MSRVNKALFSIDLKKIYSVYVEEKKKEWEMIEVYKGGGSDFNNIMTTMMSSIFKFRMTNLMQTGMISKFSIHLNVIIFFLK